jgi:hemolysin activation/secretion protein
LSLNGSGSTVPLKYAPIAFGYSGFVQHERSSYGLNMTLLTATRSFLGYGSSDQQFDDNRFKASPSFTILKADTNGTYNFANNMQIGARMSGQLTESPLVSGEQIAGGGLSSVRGYLSAEATGDYGVVGSAELRTKPMDYLNSAHVENWRAYTFVDFARLFLRSPLPEQNAVFSLASLGIGSSFELTPKVNGRLDLGYPLLNGPRTRRHSVMFNFSVTANY